MVLAFFKWCEASWLGKGISGSVYLFPVVEAVHLLALAVIGGAVLIVDMRLAGLGLKKESAAMVAKEAEPWLIGSLSVMLVSGFCLMCSEAMRCYYNDAFWLKMYSLFFAMIFTFTLRRWAALIDIASPAGQPSLRLIAFWNKISPILFLAGLILFFFLEGGVLILDQLLTFFLGIFVIPARVMFWNAPAPERLERSFKFSVGLTSLVLWSGVGLGGRGIGFY